MQMLRFIWSLIPKRLRDSGKFGVAVAGIFAAGTMFGVILHGCGK